jgi:hypothetical protein
MVSKTGNSSLRAALFMPSMVARRYNPILRPFADGLLTTGMAKKAVIGAVMHKLTHLITVSSVTVSPSMQIIYRIGLLFKTPSAPVLYASLRHKECDYCCGKRLWVFLVR